MLKGGSMKKWIKPKLIILSRGTPSVLDFCKAYDIGLGPSPSINYGNACLKKIDLAGCVACSRILYTADS